jgi:hypothetical protein
MVVSAATELGSRQGAGGSPSSSRNEARLIRHFPTPLVREIGVSRVAQQPFRGGLVRGGRSALRAPPMVSAGREKLGKVSDLPAL